MKEWITGLNQSRVNKEMVKLSIYTYNLVSLNLTMKCDRTIGRRKLERVLFQRSENENLCTLIIREYNCSIVSIIMFKQVIKK